MSECQEDARILEKDLEIILGKSNYAKIKTLDFFIERRWAMPQPLANMLEKIQQHEDNENHPAKKQRC